MLLGITIRFQLQMIGYVFCIRNNVQKGCLHGELCFTFCNKY